MTTGEKLRNTILKKVKKLPDDKLPNLDSFLNEMETQFPAKKSSLTFSGILRDLDLGDLTSDLHKTRGDVDERIPQS